MALAWSIEATPLPVNPFKGNVNAMQCKGSTDFHPLTAGKSGNVAIAVSGGEATV